LCDYECAITSVVCVLVSTSAKNPKMIFEIFGLVSLRDHGPLDQRSSDEASEVHRRESLSGYCKKQIVPLSPGYALKTNLYDNILCRIETTIRVQYAN
jgi:hypothetical protein